jgi:hypothetical protein
MENYLLILYGTRLTPNMSPEEIQAITSRYKAWAQKLQAAGRLAGSNKLEDRTGRVLRGQGAELRITDGPFAETKDVVAGYFLIQADSFEDAVEWTKSSPHLDFGTIEVRKVQVV